MSFYTLVDEIISPLRPPPGLSEELEAKALWLRNLRWAAIVAQMISIVPGLAFGFLDSKGLPAYLSVVCLLVAFNLLSPQLSSSEEKTEWDLLLHLVVDLVALGMLL